MLSLLLVALVTGQRLDALLGRERSIEVGYEARELLSDEPDGALKRLRDDPFFQSQACAMLAWELTGPPSPLPVLTADDPVAPEPAVLGTSGLPDWMSHELMAAREPLLHREGYRAVLEQSFRGTTVVRVSVHDDGTATIVAKLKVRTIVPLCRRVERTLRADELEQVRTCFADRAPWIRPHHNGLDGSTWWIEANDREGHRREQEWSPSETSPLRKCVETMMRLSGLQMLRIDD